MPTVKKQRKIQAILLALTIALVSAGLLRSDVRDIVPDNVQTGIAGDFFHGYISPVQDNSHDSRRDTGNIYADTPQLAVPRNTSVSGQPRQHSQAKRTGHDGFSEATLKDGKVITRYTFSYYFSYISLFPSGIWDGKTRLLSLKKLII